MGIEPSVIHVLSVAPLTTEQIELVSAILGFLGVTAIEETNDGIKVYDESEEDIDDLVKGLKESATWLSEASISKDTIPNENWNHSWESSFQPIVLPDFCTVMASFHDIEIDTPYTITIDPEMAFGTGHHETTHSVMQMMSKIDFTDKKVMDFGAGTGILAILAEYLGASNILAFDYDKIATECAEKCISLNDCKKVKCYTTEIHDLPKHPSYDIILANVNRNVLLKSVQGIADRHSPDGLLLLSGILIDDIPTVVQAYIAVGYRLLDQILEGEWACLQLQCNPSPSF